VPPPFPTCDTGTLEAQVIVPSMPFHKAISSKLILYFSEQNDMFWNDVEYAGGTSNWQVTRAKAFCLVY
jgi:hypothetical protein